MKRRTSQIPYGRQFVDEADAEFVNRTVLSDFLTQGPRVEEFERALAKVSGAKYAVAVSSGTAALHLAYLAAGLKKGDEVITTPNTFVATTNMLLAIGARPVFCDIKLTDHNLDENKIEHLVTPRTKAIVPVYFAGEPCEMMKINSLAKRHKLFTVADACHALGASYRGKAIGVLADMSVLSFHPVKSITTGEGGAVLTNDKELADKVRLLRSHGVTKDSRGFNVMSELGYNYRLTDIQASLGISQLKKIGKFMASRKNVVGWYQKYLSDAQGIILPRGSVHAESANHLFVIRVKRAADRLPLYNFLRGKKTMVNFHYPPVYSHPYYKKQGIKAHCPNADLYYKTAISLPIYVGLKEKQVALICRQIVDFLRHEKNTKK